MISKNSFFLGFWLIALFLPGALCAEMIEEPAETAVEEQAQPDPDYEITAEDYFREGLISNAALNPDGSILAYTSYQRVKIGNPATGFYDLSNYNDSFSIEDLYWSGNDVLIIESFNTFNGQQNFEVVKLKPSDDGYTVTRRKDLRLSGYILDPLIDDSDQIIFGKFRFKKESFSTDLYRINLFESIDTQTKRRNRLNKGLDQARFFVLDKTYQPIIGLGYDQESPQLYARTDSRNQWSMVWSGPPDAVFLPLALSVDQKTLWALSNATTDRMAAVEFDMAAAKITRTVFEHDKVDLIGMDFSDEDNRPVSVSFLGAGQVQHKFFDPSDKDSILRLRAMLQNERALVTDVNDDHTVFLVLTTSTQDPASVHLCNLVQNNCELLSVLKPWLDEEILAETLTLNTPSSGGFEVQSFLTLPVDNNVSVPLVVMPHGGPIGIQDTSYFSGDVQWLAKNGYAVLQVNYRGSAGYGKRFQSAGLRQWGRGIEDDIEASLDNALATYPILDQNRVGIYGISYGGYSALQSVIRSSDRYQCAASFAGVTDLTLLFNAPEIRSNKELRKILVEIVGDPKIDKQELMKYSPVYNYKKILKPVFLAHGTADDIVEVEHSWRLKKMLDIAGIEVDFHIFQKVGHGFQTTSEAKALYDPLIEFLDRHLK